MKPDAQRITLRDNIPHIHQMMMDLILRPRLQLKEWAEFTKQTPNIKIGYPGQHLASLVTGMEGTRTGARGHDLVDGSEVKSCSRVDQLDKCQECRAAVARIEENCPACGSGNIKRNNDSKWLFSIKNSDELTNILDSVPRVVLILLDYPNFEERDWETLQVQVFEIWPQHPRHKNFRNIMNNYFHNIYLPHIENNPNKTPAPKNFWPYHFQFYMCNPIRTFHSIVTDALSDPKIEMKEYIMPEEDRSNISPTPMPLSILTQEEKRLLHSNLSDDEYEISEISGLDEFQRLSLNLRGTDFASPQSRSYRRGSRQ